VQGQANGFLYFLLRGRCQVHHAHEDGRKHHHPVMSEGDVFGEISTVLNLAVTATVVTDTRCKLLRLGRADLERLTAENAGLREALFRLGSERLQRTARLMSDHEAPDAIPS
jgi:cAMP-dependent protein kinase regulator